LFRYKIIWQFCYWTHFFDREFFLSGEKKKKKYGIFNHSLDFGVNFYKNNLVPGRKKNTALLSGVNIFFDLTDFENLIFSKKNYLTLSQNS
jgi:hypothetical protein